MVQLIMVVPVAARAQQTVAPVIGLLSVGSPDVYNSYLVAFRDLPVCYGPRTTCYNRFVRWRRAGVWDRIMDSLAAAHDTAVQMIDTSSLRCAEQ